jgi:predicted transcriptional regulator
MATMNNLEIILNALKTFGVNGITYKDFVMSGAVNNISEQEINHVIAELVSCGCLTLDSVNRYFITEKGLGFNPHSEEETKKIVSEPLVDIKKELNKNISRKNNPYSLLTIIGMGINILLDIAILYFLLK